LNPIVQLYPTYNVFDGGDSNSIYQKSSFKDNYDTLGADLKLSYFDSNLNLRRTKEPSGGTSNVLHHQKLFNICSRI
jgi:hypothetical protein